MCVCVCMRERDLMLDQLAVILVTDYMKESKDEKKGRFTYSEERRTPKRKECTRI